MDFTQGQLDYIAKLVETQVKKATSHTKKKKIYSSSEYHTAKEIRQIILANQDFLKLELNYEPFKLHAIVHSLRKIVTLRPQDQDILSNGMVRFEYHVSSAINIEWTKTPFVKFEQNRSLRWKES